MGGGAVSDYIFAAFFDYHDKLRIDAIKVIKRSEKQVWVKASQGTGYKSRLDAAHTDGDAIATNPSKALALRLMLLQDERAKLLNKIHLINTRIEQMEHPPVVTEPK